MARCVPVRLAGVVALAIACGGTGTGGADTQDDTESGGSTGAGTSTGTSTTDAQTSATGGSTGDAGSTGGDNGSETASDSDGDNANCCVGHTFAGCNESAVEACVCQADAGCCVFEWDDVCAQTALSMCAAECVDGEDPGTTGPVVCDPVSIALSPGDDAVLTGEWVLTRSQVGEGTVAFIDDPGSAGSVLYQPDIPCADTWLVWVRYFDTGDPDSYFVTVDGEPSPDAAVFEGDCGPDGSGYGWRLLNWRDAGDPSCEYLEDPWTFDWEAGVHDIEFSLLESRALGRIIVTNDPAFTPPP